MTPELARALAAAFLSGDWDEDGLIASGTVVLRRRPAWLRPVVRQLLEVYRTAPLDRPRELAAVVQTRPSAVRAGTTRPRLCPVAATRMVSNPWHLPVLHDLADLAALLGLTPSGLAWVADPRHLARETGTPALQHYRVTTRVAASGAIRVLEAPKPRLKAAQRQLLAAVLTGIPAHDACHGFRPGRSVATFAAPHSGRAVLVRLDLEGFFASVSVGRVYGVLRTAGYPEPVAHALAGS